MPPDAGITTIFNPPSTFIYQPITFFIQYQPVTHRLTHSYAYHAVCVKKGYISVMPMTLSSYLPPMPMNTGNTYSNTSSYSSYQQNNEPPIVSYSSSSNGSPIAYNQTSGNGGGYSNFSDFSNIFGNAFGASQTGVQTGFIRNEGPKMNINFGGTPSYAAPTPTYCPPPPPAPTTYTPPPIANYCPPQPEYNYQEPPVFNFPPTQHYQQNYACYEDNKPMFPTMPRYGYTPGPDIPCPPAVSKPAHFPDYPMPMNMPGLPPQIVPFGHAQAMNAPCPPAPPELHPPAAPPQAPQFYCPPPPPKC